MSVMCPHCGKLFERNSGLIPVHTSLYELLPRATVCPGSEQYPRNPESDQRPLWKDADSNETQ